MIHQRGAFLAHRFDSNLRGRTWRTWDSYPEWDDMLGSREDLGPYPMRFINERWYGVLLHRDDNQYATAITLPESVVIEVPEFNCDNPFLENYITGRTGLLPMYEERGRRS